MSSDDIMTEQAYHILGEHRSSRWLITCDHATNRVPDWVNGGDLGIDRADMERHIAYDIGAAGMAEKLALLLDAPAIASDFSRLVIDPNRGEDDPTLLMRLYDGTIIPANKHADHDERERRLKRLYRPYHQALAALADKHPARCICAIHSFTPQLRSRPPRPWQVGILYSHKDTRLGPEMVRACRAEGWETGDNQPYIGHLDGDSIDKHALGHGRPNLLIEVRNDLITTDAGQAIWAERFARIIPSVLAAVGV